MLLMLQCYVRHCLLCLLQGDCSESDPYYDYAGSLRCLMEGGDVAFTKHTTALQYAADGSNPQTWSTKKKVGPCLRPLVSMCRQCAGRHGFTRMQYSSMIAFGGSVHYQPPVA